jgi:hypothetical protein
LAPAGLLGLVTWTRSFVRRRTREQPGKAFGRVDGAPVEKTSVLDMNHANRRPVQPDININIMLRFQISAAGASNVHGRVLGLLSIAYTTVKHKIFDGQNLGHYLFSTADVLNPIAAVSIITSHK